MVAWRTTWVLGLLAMTSCSTAERLWQPTHFPNSARHLAHLAFGTDRLAHRSTQLAAAVRAAPVELAEHVSAATASVPAVLSLHRPIMGEISDARHRTDLQPPREELTWLARVQRRLRL